MASDLVVSGRIRRGEFRLSVDLTIGPGVTAIIAPNGAGKTTLLRVIAGLEALTSGRVVVDDETLDEPSTGRFVAAEARDVAFAFQEPRLFPHLSVVDNIAYPVRRRRVAHAAAREHARRVAESVGLAPVLDARPNDLSGGQAQRVNVARALAADAATLLLDEPLASVDDESRTALRERLVSSASERVVWVTHDPSDLSHADTVISLPDVFVTDGNTPDRA